MVKRGLWKALCLISQLNFSCCALARPSYADNHIFVLRAANLLTQRRCHFFRILHDASCYRSRSVADFGSAGSSVVWYISGMSNQFKQPCRVFLMSTARFYAGACLSVNFFKTSLSLISLTSFSCIARNLASASLACSLNFCL